MDKKEAQTLAEELLSLTLISISANQSVTKKLPSSLTIVNLKILCQRLFKIDQTYQKIYYKSGKDMVVPENLNDDTQPLSYYGVKDNGEIIIEQIQ